MTFISPKLVEHFTIHGHCSFMDIVQQFNLIKPPFSWSNQSNPPFFARKIPMLIGG